jgi:hypothetical protein
MSDQEKAEYEPLFNLHGIPSEIYKTLNELCGAQFESGAADGENETHIEKATNARDLIEQQVAALTRQRDDAVREQDAALAEQHIMGNAVSAMLDKYGPIKIPNAQIIRERAITLNARDVGDEGIEVFYTLADKRCAQGIKSHDAVRNYADAALRKQLDTARAECERLRKTMGSVKGALQYITVRELDHDGHSAIVACARHAAAVITAALATPQAAQEVDCERCGNTGRFTSISPAGSCPVCNGAGAGVAARKAAQEGAK